MNAHAERFVRSIRSECLDQMIFLGRASLENAISEYVAHYHDERSHQGLGNEIVSRVPVQREGTPIEFSDTTGAVAGRRRIERARSL